LFFGIGTIAAITDFETLITQGLLASFSAAAIFIGFYWIIF
jgi:hypothetical protein